MGNSCANVANIKQPIFQEGDNFGEVLSLSHESAIDPCNLPNLDSDDEDSFNESIEYAYITELEVLSSEKAIIKDVLDSMIHIIANENTSIN